MQVQLAYKYSWPTWGPQNGSKKPKEEEDKLIIQTFVLIRISFGGLRRKVTFKTSMFLTILGLSVKSDWDWFLYCNNN